MNDSNKLIGWKAIADYADLSERQLRRHELDGNLPIRREGQSKRAPVWITTEELDAFLKARNSTPPPQPENIKKTGLWLWILVFILALSNCLMLFFPRKGSVQWIQSMQMEKKDGKLTFYAASQNQNRGRQLFKVKGEDIPIQTIEEAFQRGYVSWFGEFFMEPTLVESISSSGRYLIFHQWNKEPQSSALPSTLQGTIVPERILFLNRLQGIGFDALGVLTSTLDPGLQALLLYGRDGRLKASLITPSSIRQVVAIGSCLALLGEEDAKQSSLILVPLWEIMSKNCSRLPELPLSERFPLQLPKAHWVINSSFTGMDQQNGVLKLMNGEKESGISISGEGELFCVEENTDLIFKNGAM